MTKMYEDAAKVLKEVHLNYDPHAKLGTLSVSQMQLVEIARRVSADCKVLILDEPTSSLTAAEVEALFTIVNELRAKGVSIVYISHKMDEILRISDEVTIMRDGQYIGTWEAKELTTDMIITKMVGRELSNLYPPRSNTPGEVVFEVKDFTSINPKSFRHVTSRPQGRDPRRCGSGRCPAHRADGGPVRSALPHVGHHHL